MVTNWLDNNLWGLLRAQFWEYKYYYLGAFCSLFATHWVQAELPFLAKDLADMVTMGKSHIKVSTFIWFALAIITFRTISRLLFFYPARVLQKNLRVELMARLENAIPFRYQNKSNGQIYQTLDTDMDHLRTLIGFALLHLGSMIIALSIFLPKLNSFNSHLLISLTPLLVAFILFSFLIIRNQTFYRKSQDLQGDIQNLIMETYIAKKTIKNFHAEKTFIDWFQKISLKELSNFYKASMGTGVAMPLLPLAIGISLLWGSWIIRTHDLGVSSLILFGGFTFLFMEPMMLLAWIGGIMVSSYGSWQRICELVKDLKTPSPEEIIFLKSNHLTLNNDIYNMSLQFWDRPLNIKCLKNSWTVLVGKTGCGKSWLLIQMANLFKLNHDSISLIHQAPYLYNDSIKGNIFLGRSPNPKEERAAHELLHLFGLDTLSSRSDDLMKLEVGEYGKYLSGGQLKRLSLIRSLMGQADILLWDDPFSSVDIILEKQIVNRLKKLPLMKNKTLILSSHRLTTVYLSQNVIFLKEKKGIVESGLVSKLLTPHTKTYEYFKDQLV